MGAASCECRNAQVQVNAEGRRHSTVADGRAADLAAFLLEDVEEGHNNARPAAADRVPERHRPLHGDRRISQGHSRKTAQYSPPAHARAQRTERRGFSRAGEDRLIHLRRLAKTGVLWRGAVRTPKTLTRFGSRPSSLLLATETTAKASLISKKST